MSRLGDAIALAQRNDPAAARSLLEMLWSDVGSDGDPLHRCAIAHHLADVQNELTDELAWDLEALSAAESLTNDRLTASGTATTAQGLYPSLHLNLADVYRRLGDRTQAQHHLDRGRRSCVALPHNDYGAMIREALDRVEQRLVEPSAPPAGVDPPDDA